VRYFEVAAMSAANIVAAANLGKRLLAPVAAADRLPLLVGGDRFPASIYPTLHQYNANPM
jgi:hypothetical protein